MLGGGLDIYSQIANCSIQATARKQLSSNGMTLSNAGKTPSNKPGRNSDQAMF